MNWPQIKDYLITGLADYKDRDLRWSYLIVSGFVVLGIIVNLYLPHGWTVWPIVLAVGLLILMNEAADRNGQGIPPLQVYAMFAAVIVFWFVFVMALSTIHPLILMLGILILGYQCARGYLKHRERQRIIDERRVQGLCVHCGEPADAAQTYCANCGEEPNPDGARLRWALVSMRGAQTSARMRAVLKPVSNVEATKMKEQALLARRHRRPTKK